jgi:Transmembrane secretion effector
VGPALSGVLVAVFEPGVVYAIDSFSFAISAVFLARLRLKPREPSPRQHFLADLLDGAREAWSHIWLRVGFLAAAVANVGIGIMFVLGPLIAADELGGATAWGIILTGGAVGGLLGASWLSASDRGGRCPLRWSPGRLGRSRSWRSSSRSRRS